MRLAFAPYRLTFKFPAGTSRGVLLSKQTYFLKYYNPDYPDRAGYGEAAVFEGLSPEWGVDFEDKLKELSRAVRQEEPIVIGQYSSIVFGFEQAVSDYENGCGGIYFPSSFICGESSIKINGLIWMGNHEEMQRRLLEKIDAGFSCIKIKIGAIRWNEELELLRMARELTAGRDIDLRVDANGAFTPEDCMKRLDDLAPFGLHSIEQPLKAGSWNELSRICRESPVPVALDEELIGIDNPEKRRELLDFVRPQYIVLKPALCFGFSGATDWIEAARGRGIGWWLTSALESSVGLNALAQFTATLDTRMAQGLGTGNLYTNNLESPLKLEGERLRMTRSTKILTDQLELLQWREY